MDRIPNFLSNGAPLARAGSSAMPLWAPLGRPHHEMVQKVNRERQVSLDEPFFGIALFSIVVSRELF